MAQSASTGSGIARWEVLPGLPGAGAVPVHFHVRNATPWSEGFVVRFWNYDGSQWVANFQRGSAGHNRVLLWPEAQSIAVLAGGYFYLVNTDARDSYVTLGSQTHRLVSDLHLDERRQTLFVAGQYSVYAFDVSRRLLWEKQSGGRIAKILSCDDCVLTLEIVRGTEQPLKTLQITTTEETILARRYLDILFGVLETHPDVKRIGPGLSDSEVETVERQFRFAFPADLRRLLQFATPVGPSFPDWRNISGEDLRSRISCPFNGIWFDVSHCGFWLPEWGRKPTHSEIRREAVRHSVSLAPRLIPICACRYIPSMPCNDGNPVFSVDQTHFAYAGNDLADYFFREFRVPLPKWAATEPRKIPFWSDAVEWRQHHEYYKTK